MPSFRLNKLLIYMGRDGIEVLRNGLISVSFFLWPDRVTRRVTRILSLPTSELRHERAYQHVLADRMAGSIVRAGGGPTPVIRRA